MDFVLKMMHICTRTWAASASSLCGGSHKSSYPLPHSIRTANVRTPIRHLEIDAGDVLFFLGGAVSHGAYRWESVQPRRAALFSYAHPAGRGFSWPARL